jgi:FAD/FMN-containing dehydrogenase
MPATDDAAALLRYRAAREILRAQYDAIPAGERVRLAKKTSNLFRMRDGATAPGLDVAAFDGVLSIDPEARTADVLGMTTYEHLVDATLPYGLMPLVVPELKTITLGGAVSGLGIESSSFRNGCPHESVLELEVMTGDGRIVTASREESADLLEGFPNSYGTLGYALRLTIELEPVQPFVRLAHVRFDDAEEYFRVVAEVCASREHPAVAGRHVEFVDGTVFGPDELYLTLGTFEADAPYVSDYTGREIYYRSVQSRMEDHLTVRDYLWRWDTDWFWCSRALGAQHPLVRPLLPRSVLRSDVYWKLVGFERRHGWLTAARERMGAAPTEAVIQDVEVPVERAAEFLRVFQNEIGISPVWMCPVRQRDADRRWELYALDPSTTYVNFGFWASVELGPGQVDGVHNRRIERLVADLGGRKSLYSSSYYDEDEFWATYNGPVYELLKKKYDPDGRLLDLYEKCVTAR